MGRLFVATLSYLASISISIIAFLFQINGHTTLEISTRLPVLLAPAVYAYVIILFINILIIFWLYTYWKKYKTSENITVLQATLFVLVNIFYILTILTWHHYEFISSIITLVLLVTTLAILYFTYPYSDNKLSSRMPISISFGWITFLFMTNANFVLTLNEWNGFGLSYQLWTVVAMTLGTAIAMHVRYHFYDVAFPSVLIWAYVAVAVHNSFDELLVSTAALFLSGVMLVGIFFMKKNPAHQFS